MLAEKDGEKERAEIPPRTSTKGDGLSLNSNIVHFFQTRQKYEVKLSRVSAV